MQTSKIWKFINFLRWKVTLNHHGAPLYNECSQIRFQSNTHIYNKLLKIKGNCWCWFIQEYENWQTVIKLVGQICSGCTVAQCWSQKKPFRKFKTGFRNARTCLDSGKCWKSGAFFRKKYEKLENQVDFPCVWWVLGFFLTDPKPRNEFCWILIFFDFSIYKKFWKSQYAGLWE